MPWTAESNRKRNKTLEEKYGPDHRQRISAMGGRKRTRGYFGYLKDTDPDKLAEISQEAGAKSSRAKKK